MQIVIDIPDRIYKMINAKYWLGSIDTDVINKAIKNGTPLPKGHGRLIDADALEKSMIEREERLGDEQAIWESSAVSVALDNFAKTIIEADREVDND